jgi:hypothetical protein
MRGIFISYRRDQAAAQAGRLYDWLVSRFGDDRVFMDVDSIRPGVDYVDVIQNAVTSCDVLLALIGESWAGAQDEQGKRRIDNPDDFVRVEIATALQRHIPVVPILLNRASLPEPDVLPTALRPLVRRQHFELSDVAFRVGVVRLVEQLGEILEGEASAVEPPSPGAFTGAKPDVWSVVRVHKSWASRTLEVRLGPKRYEIKALIPARARDGQPLLVNGERPDITGQSDRRNWKAAGMVNAADYRFLISVDERTVPARLVLAYVNDYHKVTGAYFEVDGHVLCREGKGLPRSALPEARPDAPR